MNKIFLTFPIKNNKKNLCIQCRQSILLLVSPRQKKTNIENTVCSSFKMFYSDISWHILSNLCAFPENKHKPLRPYTRYILYLFLLSLSLEHLQTWKLCDVFELIFSAKIHPCHSYIYLWIMVQQFIIWILNFKLNYYYLSIQKNK